MQTLIIEGFTIRTNLDEQSTFKRLGSTKEDLEEEIVRGTPFMDFLEHVVIGGQSTVDYFYDNYRGYKNRSLEPYNYRETKKVAKLIYTGSQGGGAYEIEIIK